MAISYKANNRARKNLYDRVELLLPSGSREKLKSLADAEGVTLSRYVVRALETVSGLSLELGEVPPQIAAARARKAEQRGPGAQGTEQPQITEQAAGDDPAR